MFYRYEDLDIENYAGDATRYASDMTQLFLNHKQLVSSLHDLITIT